MVAESPSRQGHPRHITVGTILLGRRYANAMIVTHPKLTFEEYLNYDDGTDTYYELVDGELVEVPLASRRHWKISKRLERLFEEQIAELNCNWDVGRGDVGVKTRGGKSDNNRIPDVVVFNSETDSILDESNILTNAPILVVEIVSPGKANRERDYIEKRREYEEIGIPEYWIVDPDGQQIVLLSLEGKTYREEVYTGDRPLVSLTFPGLTLTCDSTVTT